MGVLDYPTLNYPVVDDLIYGCPKLLFFYYPFLRKQESMGVLNYSLFDDLIYGCPELGCPLFDDLIYGCPELGCPS